MRLIRGMVLDSLGASALSIAMNTEYRELKYLKCPIILFPIPYYNSIHKSYQCDSCWAIILGIEAMKVKDGGMEAWNKS